MLTQTDIQNTILRAKQKGAVAIQAATALEKKGGVNVDWWPATRWYFNIVALERQFNLGDYNSVNTIIIYNCLNKLIGQDTSIITVDPNYQPPGGVIIIPNPNYLQPVVLEYDDFDPTSQLSDEGRTRYINTAWKGVNPFMTVTAPALIGLQVNTDYTLWPAGGFELIDAADGGNFPEIYPGGKITVYNYALA